MAYDKVLTGMYSFAKAVALVCLGLWSGIGLFIYAVDEPIASAVMRAEGERAPAIITVECRAVEAGERSCRLASIERPKEPLK